MTDPRIPSDVLPLLRATNVHKSFGSTSVLQGVNLDVAEGEVCCLLGRSGSGKSTFLRCINQLEVLTQGQIHLAGERIGYERKGDRLYPLKPRQVAAQRRDIGMVFQRFNLFPHLTVLENVMEAPIQVRGIKPSEAKTRAIERLKQVGLQDRGSAYPAQLSGGQQQRVAIARALAMEPRLMLFDEPTSALDPELVGEVLSTMRELANQGTTMIVVTHEIAFAREVADTVVFMDEGRIVEQGSPAQVLREPTHPVTRNFLARVLGHD